MNINILYNIDNQNDRSTHFQNFSKLNNNRIVQRCCETCIYKTLKIILLIKRNNNEKFAPKNNVRRPSTIYMHTIKIVVV